MERRLAIADMSLADCSSSFQRSTANGCIGDVNWWTQTCEPDVRCASLGCHDRGTRTKPLARYWRLWRVMRADLCAAILWMGVSV
jgi:hypothetical protein